ncbi:flagellar motor protein MotB [Pseudochelatococcus sp. B33]
MDKIEQELILIQRRNREPEDHGAHGIWKIAYADFMTALMAFFLIMWLLNVTDKEQRVSVANYFNPIKLADISPTRKGVEEPQETPPKDDTEGEKAITPTQTETANTGASLKMTGDAAHAAKPRFPESVLFMDPYAILAKLADDDKPADRTLAATAEIATERGSPRTSTVRDPFDPAYWRLAPEGQPSAVSQDGQPQAGTSGGTGERADNTEPAPFADLIDPAEQEQAREISALREGVADALKDESPSSAAPAVDVERTGEGILISLTDAEAFSMFAIGSAEPKPEVVRALARIGSMLAERPGTIVVRGHTDSLPFKSDNYDNWRLSSARAHMASYMLIRGGLDQNRVERIEGYADRRPRNAQDTRAAENRRIEILLREKSG